MTKFILRVFSWLLVVGVCSAQTSGGVQNGRLTHDLTVGAAHDIQLKGGQTVQVLSQSASTVVIMVQLSDGSNGVYQLAPGDVQMIQQEDAAPPPAANSTAAGGVMAAPTVNEMPTLSQINSLPRRLSLVASVSPQNLDIKTGSDEKLQIDALPKGTILTPLDVQGDNLVVSIQGRIVSSELIDPNWNNTSLNVNVAPHTVMHSRDVSGRGLIPLSDTDYSQVVAGMGDSDPTKAVDDSFKGLESYINAVIKQVGNESQKISINIKDGDVSIASVFQPGIVAGIHQSGLTQKIWFNAHELDSQNIKVLVAPADVPVPAGERISISLQTKGQKFVITEKSLAGCHLHEELTRTCSVGFFLNSEQDAQNIKQVLQQYISWIASQPQTNPTEADRIWLNSEEGKFALLPESEQAQWKQNQMELLQNGDFKTRIMAWAREQYDSRGIGMSDKSLADELEKKLLFLTTCSPVELNEYGGIEMAVKEYFLETMDLSDMPVSTLAAKRLQFLKLMNSEGFQHIVDSIGTNSNESEFSKTFAWGVTTMRWEEEKQGNEWAVVISMPHDTETDTDRREWADQTRRIVIGMTGMSSGEFSNVMSGLKEDNRFVTQDGITFKGVEVGGAPYYTFGTIHSQ